MSRICIICPVRKGTPEAVFNHVAELEKEGHNVFFPARDIAGTMPEIDICQRMLMELDIADEIHVYYSGNSQGVHFDMGIVWTMQHWLEHHPKVVWLNPSESKRLKGYESVLKEMCK